MSTSSTVRAWSTTDATNASTDSNISSSDSQSPDTLDNNVRSIMAAVKKQMNDIGGSLAAGGTANALTVTTGQVLESGQLTDGLRVLLKATADNTLATVTFAPDGLTARNIKRADGSALAVGSIKSGMYLDLVYNSAATEWRAANIAPPAAFLRAAKQTFVANGTYTPTTGMVYCIIECVGGGAGGGGCANSSAGQQGSGGGGGGGSYARLIASAATIGASQAVTVGAAANGGTAGNNAGTAGNDTSVGALCIGKGGSAGGGAAANANGTGGAGGIAGTGDFSVPGQAGASGGFSVVSGAGSVQFSSASGGSSGLSFGFGAVAGGGSGTGNNGSNYGGGGAGGRSSSASGAAAGGIGAAGIVVITEFCTA